MNDAGSATGDTPIAANPESVPPAGSATAPGRVYYLDSLRVLAMVIVFMYHALHPFDLYGWHIKNDELSLPLTVVMAFFSTWGMPFFFLLAGASTWFALRRRSAAEYVNERLRRLIIPFVVGSFVLGPFMMVLEWSHGAPKGLWPATFAGYLAARTPSLGPGIFGWLGFHLWFLGFLFCFSVICLPFFEHLKGDSGKRAVDWMASLSGRRGGLLAYLAPLALIQVTLRPFATTEHDWADFLFQITFFALGFILLSDRRHASAIARDWKINLAAAVGSFIGLSALYGTGNLDAWTTDSTQAGFYLLWLCVTLSAWSWTLVFLWIGMRFMDRASPLISQGQEAVLPIYVIHQPIIMFVAFYVVQWPLPMEAKALLVVASAVLACAAIYIYGIRRLGFLAGIFGIRKPPAPATVPALPLAD